MPPRDVGVGDPATINLIDDPWAECVCVADHNPNAIQLHRHHILPLAWGGTDDPSNVVLLCPSTHANVHRLIREYANVGGVPSWTLRRRFGWYARQLADDAWRAWLEQEPVHAV